MREGRDEGTGGRPGATKPARLRSLKMTVGVGVNLVTEIVLVVGVGILVVVFVEEVEYGSRCLVHVVVYVKVDVVVGVVVVPEVNVKYM